MQPFRIPVPSQGPFSFPFLSLGFLLCLVFWFCVSFFSFYGLSRFTEIGSSKIKQVKEKENVRTTAAAESCQRGGRTPAGGRMERSERGKTKAVPSKKKKEGGLTTAARSWQCSRVRARARTPRGRPSHAAPRHTKSNFSLQNKQREIITQYKQRKTNRETGNIVTLESTFAPSTSCAYQQCDAVVTPEHAPVLHVTHARWRAQHSHPRQMRFLR